jgi:hypothetical protein
MRIYITLLFIALAFSTTIRQAPVLNTTVVNQPISGQGQNQINFTDNDILTFRFFNNYYMFTDAEECLPNQNMTTGGNNMGNRNMTNIDAGRNFTNVDYQGLNFTHIDLGNRSNCGRFLGLPITFQGNLDVILSQNNPLHFQLIRGEQDFYCIRSRLYNAFLFLDGQQCSGINTEQQCGRVVLNNANKCERQFGWRIININNLYAFQSIAFPNIYLYFDNTGCSQTRTGRGLQVANNTVITLPANATTGAANENDLYLYDNDDGCGRFMGIFIKDINGIQQSDQRYQRLFFTLNRLNLQQGNMTLAGGRN